MRTSIPILVVLLSFASIAAAQPDPLAEPAPAEPIPETEPAAPTPDAAAPAPPPDAPQVDVVVPDDAGGPVIEMADDAEADADSEAPEPASDDPLLRGMQEERFRRARDTSLGGYGELHLNIAWPETGGPEETELDLHRLVLFVAHRFDETFRFYVEFEVEHALVIGGESSGQLGIEQAFVDWRVLGDLLAVRGGIVLVPMGIINQWHEPPIFHGVERPMVDRVIVPSTWREAGLGIFGEPIEGLRYELYVIGGLDPRGFSGSSGLRGGRQGISESVSGFPAFTARVEVEPTLGMIAGVSGYFGMAGRSAHLDIDVPVGGVSVDWRMRRFGIEARAMLAYFSIGDVDELRALTDEDGTPLGINVGSALMGAYAELAYDVLHLADTEHALVPFVRLEWLDTTLDESNAGFNRPSIVSLVGGLTYRPIPQLSIKVDFVLRRPEGGGGENIVDVGLGWMF